MSIGVSIIIPVYNMEKYLDECLESLFSQTYSNIEVIILNDGSTDTSKDIIKKYMDKYENIIYIEQDNQGLSVARNNALKYINGEYILFVDSDDYLEKDCLEFVYRKAKETNSDMVIMGHKKIYRWRDDIRIDYKEYVDENEVYTGKYVADLMLKDIIEGYSCDKLIKSDNLIKNSLEYEKYRKIEDLYPIFKYVYNCNTITFINKCLYNYRQRDNSLSHKMDDKLIQDYSYAREQILNYLKLQDYNNKEIIFVFKYNSFRSITNFLNKQHNKKYNIYKIFYKNGYNIYQPNIKDIYHSKEIKLLSKLDLILWKFRIYHLLMPELVVVKKYIDKLKTRDIQTRYIKNTKIIREKNGV